MSDVCRFKTNDYLHIPGHARTYVYKVWNANPYTSITTMLDASLSIHSNKWLPCRSLTPPPVAAPEISRQIEEYLNKRLNVRKKSVHNKDSLIPVVGPFPVGSAPAGAVVPAPSDVVLLPPRAASASDFCAWVQPSQRPEAMATATSSFHIPQQYTSPAPTF